MTMKLVLQVQTNKFQGLRGKPSSESMQAEVEERAVQSRKKPAGSLALMQRESANGSAPRLVSET